MVIYRDLSWCCSTVRVLHNGFIQTGLLGRIMGSNALLPFAVTSSGCPFETLASTLALVVQLVNLLEGQTLSLVDEEVHEGNAEEAGTEPDEEDLGLQVGVVRAVVNQVRGDECDDEVEKPLFIRLEI